MFEAASAMLKSVRYQVGRWTFVPSAHEIRSGPARVRLQQRASATLSLLCERSGEVVSRQDIIDRAWGRQHLSSNSVAIVIGDLRRALGIAADEPGSIETVPKAGYRLIGNAHLPEAKRTRSSLALLTLIAAFVLAAAIAIVVMRTQAMKPEVAIGGIENATGTARFTPLMRACSETLLVDLSKHSDGLRVVEAGQSSGDADYVIQQRWVLWSGEPELVLVAHDRSGRVAWSGAVYGPEDQFPAKISDKIGQFSAFARNAARRS